MLCLQWGFCRCFVVVLLVIWWFRFWLCFAPTRHLRLTKCLTCLFCYTTFTGDMNGLFCWPALGIWTTCSAGQGMWTACFPWRRLWTACFADQGILTANFFLLVRGCGQPVLLVRGWEQPVVLVRGWVQVQVIGALSPLNRKGLYQGWGRLS